MDRPVPDERSGRPGKRVLLWSGLCAAILAVVAVLTHLQHRDRSLDYHPGDPVVRLYAADLSGSPFEPGDLVMAISRSGADIVVLQNVGPAAFDAVDAALPALRYRVSAPQASSAAGGGETLIASRYALLGREESQHASGASLRTVARTPIGRIELISLSAAGRSSGALRFDRTPGVAAVAVAWQPGVAAHLGRQDMRPVADPRLFGGSRDSARAVWRSKEIGVVAHRADAPAPGMRPALIADLNLSRRR